MPSSGFKLPADHPDGHLRLVEYVLSGIREEAARRRWVKVVLPGYSLHIGGAIERALEPTVRARRRP